MTKCILIVDDEADVREVTKLGLEMSTDWQILTATSGADAIEIAAQAHLDAILLDMMMPDMDGRATLKQLKTDQTQAIPVILVTAKAHPSNQQDFDSLDVAAVLAKPFRPLKLAAKISRILGWE